MPGITNNQTIILEAAAGRDDGLLLPLPSSLAINNKSAARNVLRSLIRRGLAEECAARLSDQSWRTQGETPITLVSTSSGHSAVGSDVKFSINPASKGPAGNT